MAQRKNEHTERIQKSLETREKFPISHFDSRKYIQHNLNLGDGLGPILAFMDALPADRTKVDVRRSFEDGHYSVAHADYVLGDWGPMVGFEIHRWEDERIVEHWDNLQPTPATANASGRTMTDGPHEILDLDKTTANKALVEAFTTDVLIGKHADRAGKYINADTLIQHSPLCGDGASTWIATLGGQGQVSRAEYHTLHKILGEGNWILAMSEGALFGEGTASQPTTFYDLYRIENGVIAEHWDVTEPIPPRDQWQNDNGKF